MSGITIAEATVLQIQYTDEERGEDILLISLTGKFVQRFHHTRRIVLMGRNQTEIRVDGSHHHSRRDAFSTDITDAEKQFSVAHEIVVDVTAHLLGCRHPTGNPRRTSLQTCLRQHIHLDIAGDTEFTAQPFLFQTRVVEFLFTAGKPMDDETEHTESEQREQAHQSKHPFLFAIHLIVVAHHNQPPMRIASHKSIDDATFRSIDITDEGEYVGASALTLPSFLHLTDGDFLHYLSHLFRVEPPHITLCGARNKVTVLRQQQVE